MPLLLPTLKTELSSLFTDFPTTHLAAANRWAAAYANYAASGLAVAGGSLNPGLLTAPKLTLASNLNSLFATQGTPASFSASFAAYFTAFWMSPPIVFVPIPPALSGLVTAVAGTAALQAALTAAPPANTAAAARDYLAGALDTFTKTVVGTFILPTPAPPVIIPLT